MKAGFFFIKKILFVLFTVCFLLPLNAQTVPAKLPGNLDWKAIETEFYRQLNGLRSQKKLSILTPNDPVLDTAAFDQAAYMQRKRVVTHDQSGRKKATPFKRIQFYGGHFTIVGENCIMIFLNTAMNTKYSKKPITVSREEEVATALFLGWKNSPKHYKNMLTKEYQLAGLGFAFDPKTNQLYSAQVFGGNYTR